MGEMKGIGVEGAPESEGTKREIAEYFSESGLDASSLDPKDLAIWEKLRAGVSIRELDEWRTAVVAETGGVHSQRNRFLSLVSSAMEQSRKGKDIYVLRSK